MSNYRDTHRAPSNTNSFSYQKRKENFLRYIFYAASILALPAILVTISYTQNMLLNGLYVGAYVILLLVAFVKLPFWLKATVLLVLTYALGLSNLFETGIWGDARLFFLALIALSVLLFSLRVAILTGLVSLATITVVGWLTLSGQITLISSDVNPGSTVLWVAGGAVLLLLAAILASGIRTVQAEFISAIDETENYLSRQGEENANLEERVRERTQALDRRSEQLEAAALVTRAAAELRDMNQLLNVVVQQITTRFNFYHTGIFLADASGSQLTLVAASSKGGQNLLARGYKLEIGREGIVEIAAYQKRPRIAQDVGADAIYFNNPDLPGTHSQVALPLLAQNRLIGVLDIQSQEHNAFSSDDIYTLQTMTDQIAMAIENIRLIEQSQSALANLESLNAGNTSKAWKERLGEQTKGFVYTPLGVNPLVPGQKSDQRSDSNESSFKIPLSLRGKNIGSLALKRKSTDSGWAETEKEMAERIANQVVLAIENARLLEESQRRAAREQTVNELSSRFSRSLDVDTLLQNAVRELHGLPQVSEVSVFINPADETKKSE
jgi:GAF domain-containing protein